MRIIALAAASLLLAAAAPKEPELVFEPYRTPARSVEASRWGERLQPVTLTGDARRVLGDSTHVDGEPGDTPFWHALAVEGDYLFTATGQGMKLYDISAPTAPIAFGFVDASEEITWWHFTDKNSFITSIGVPEGNSNVVVTGAEDFGFIVWDTSNKGDVGYHYGDSDVYVRYLYVAAIGARAYAFALSGGTVRLYDLTAAAALDSCHEQDQSCPGVSKGVVMSGSSASVAIGGTGDFVVYRNLVSISILDASNISSFPGGSPPIKLTGTLSGISGTGETVMWEYGGSHYLAIPVKVGTAGKLWVYDVSCITNAGACTLPTPTVYSTSSVVAPTTVSVSFGADGKPYLYVGSTQIFGNCVPQREYLYDASDPAALVELTPQGHPEGYWGWYYEDCGAPPQGGPGFNAFAPRGGRLGPGDVLYRAGFSILDSHQLLAPPPDPSLVFADGFESGDTSAWGAP